MRRLALLALVSAGVAASLESQEPFQIVRGTVRDTAGAPLPGAEVLLASRRVSTNSQGRFRIDSVVPGRYLITVRLPGYTAHRARIDVSEREPVDLSVELVPAALVLPPVVTVTRRTGIYGTVGTAEGRPLAGTFVQAAGVNGGEVYTDTGGRFSFPGAHRGPYLLRITRSGYGERRLMLELDPGEGREVAIQLYPSTRPASRADDLALEGLHKRIAFNPARERMTPAQLARYGTGGLCDIPRLLSEVGRGNSTTTVIVNGVTVLPEFPVLALCAWRADEVDLVEFGRDICADVTQSVGATLPRPVWCSGRTRGVTRSMSSGGGRIRTQAGSTSYVVIWERR